MASLSDIFTAAQNLVQAVNNLTTTYLGVEGAQNTGAIVGSMLIKSKAGRVARISVTTAGSTTGVVYDGATLSAISIPIYVIPEAIGVYVLNLPVNFGIVVTPGTGQVLTVSWS